MLFGRQINKAKEEIHSLEMEKQRLELQLRGLTEQNDLRRRQRDELEE